MKRIAVVFPGIGYTLDKPLLYYGRKLLKKSGYEEIKLLDYTGLGSVSIKGNADKMAKAFDVIYSKTEEYLKDIHWEEYDELLFLSKSIIAIGWRDFGDLTLVEMEGKAMLRILWSTAVCSEFL